MMQERWCRAECYPELSISPACHRHSLGGGRVSWFVLLAFCQEGIWWGWWACAFLWVLFKLSCDGKLPWNLQSKWFQCLHTFVCVSCILVSVKVSLWEEVNSLPPRLPMTILQTYRRSRASWQRKGFSWLREWTFDHMLMWVFEKQTAHRNTWGVFTFTVHSVEFTSIKNWPCIVLVCVLLNTWEWNTKWAFIVKENRNPREKSVCSHFFLLFTMKIPKQANNMRRL